MSRGESVTVRHPVPAPESFRQTLVSTFDLCQYSAYLSVLTGGLKPAHPLFRGRAFHEMASRAITAMLANGEITIAPDDAKTIMVEVLNDHPEWVVPAYALDELRVMVHRFATHFRLPSPGCVAESPWTLDLGHPVTGTIDLCWREGDTLHIRDFKAGWHVFSQGDVAGKDQETGKARGARAAQLIVYAILAADGEPQGPVPFDRKGINSFDCRFVFPMQGGDEGMLERHVTITRPELIEHREWLRRTVKNMRNRFAADQFTATPGSHCRRCSEAGECPLKHQTSTVGPFERPASEAAEDWVFLRRDADELWEALKVYATQFGPVPVGSDQEIGLNATASGPRLALRTREAKAA